MSPLPFARGYATSQKETIESLTPYCCNTFKMLKDKQEQWSAFLARNHLQLYEHFPDVVDRLETFIEAACHATSRTAENATWEPNEWRWKLT